MTNSIQTNTDVNSNLEGNYTTSYSVTDDAGHTTTLERNVRVESLHPTNLVVTAPNATVLNTNLDLSFSATKHVASNGPLEYKVELGEAEPLTLLNDFSVTSTYTHIGFSDAGSKAFKITVKDGDGRIVSLFHDVIVFEEESEKSLIDLNIQSNDIDVLKAASFSNKSNNKGTVDDTSRAKIKQILSVETDVNIKRRKRRAALKLMFSRDTDIKKMVIPNEDLQLPEGFKKTKALVVKAGETFNVSELDEDEGFYTVLDDGEVINIKTQNETTLTFTRSDNNYNELYTVNTGDWANIAIDSDNVTGTFSNDDKAGTLAPGDSVTIDGRIFIIGSIADGGEAGSSGDSGADPYVSPIYGPTYKLPSTRAIYRFLGDIKSSFVVNAQVEQLPVSASQDITSFSKPFINNTNHSESLQQRLTADGYFYRYFFIKNKTNKFVIDLEKLLVIQGTQQYSLVNQHTFNLNNVKITVDNKFGYTKIVYPYPENEILKTITLETATSEFGKVNIEFSIFVCPQIRNGVKVDTSKPIKKVNSNGLLVCYQKAKEIKVPRLTYTKKMKPVVEKQEKKFVTEEFRYYTSDGKLLNERKITFIQA